MIIVKSVDKKGDAAVLSPTESLGAAITAALKTKNTEQEIFWADPKTLRVESLKSTPGAEGWEAWAHGEVEVGKTDAATDRFFAAKKHSFSVNYKQSRDDMGIPCVKIIEADFTPVSNNPSASAGPVNLKTVSEIVKGELAPSGGVITSKLVNEK